MNMTVYIAGNWKMNNSPNETEDFMTNLGQFNIDAKSYGLDNSIKAIVCPSSIALERASDKKPAWLELGAQDSYFEESGAYTGEVSPSMLKDFGVKYVIVGHSERRNIFGEVNEDINKKVKKILELDMIPILCVGENDTEREQGITFPVIEIQIKKALWGIDKNELNRIIIAYEPVWAIGTGKAATPEDAEEVGSYIKEVLANIDQRNGEAVPVLYGGSVNPDNIAGFVNMGNIDGALVGGKSVKSDSFVELIKKVSEII
ncbi:triose-phosphate isomerase [Natranaerofaba carboxydovora]|uniref:triose-phosphate isomerase n=1 Tax=Natranaerofaba carboxydovora TaxID=2742683 RepID=UPI001F12CA18|nr:triose-phosphate isomerase [Natranaerofaba carboxydovora]UMZ72658.1 Triosephosphate isomerase [Natranaerofaba carboxydovora]